MANLKLKYKKIIELGMIGSLALIVLIFQVFRAINLEAVEEPLKGITIEVTEIPITKHFEPPPPPPKPSIPIPTENEDVPDDATIEDTDLDFLDIPALPSPPEDDAETGTFWAYDEAPEPIGGFSAIYRALRYPEIARKAGIEGKVIVRALVSEKGQVVKTKIMKSLGHSGCDDAAVNAIRSVKWKPAMQRDMPVKVWVAITVVFRLK